MFLCCIRGQRLGVGGHHRDPVRPLAFGRGRWLLLLGCHVGTSGLVAGGQGQWVPGGLLALVWGNPVMGLGCERWARGELGLMVVASAALNGGQAGLRGMAQAGQ